MYEELACFIWSFELIMCTMKNFDSDIDNFVSVSQMAVQKSRKLQEMQTIANLGLRLLCQMTKIQII